LDHFTSAFPVWLSGLLGAWLVIGAGVYFCLVRFVGTGGGKVSVEEFGHPELLMCAAFLIWFALAIASGFGGPDRDVTQKDIVRGGILFLLILATIGGFLQFRGINPFRQFGLGRRNVVFCLGVAAGLLLCAYPLVSLTGQLTNYALSGKARPQNIVEFFKNASDTSDTGAIYVTMVLGVVVAPAAEETIFRGFIYGVLKRYTGGVAAAVISAGVFAAMHLSLSSLPALFVLALCFTLAYEATGSLLVNIFMHALFNLSMFLVLLGISQHPVSP
jgi:membrane protease YdiL (CAAX protease family)